jgi:hypothetical protein
LTPIRVNRGAADGYANRKGQDKSVLVVEAGAGIGAGVGGAYREQG